jgi:glycosyltransferase involved in cell wall biosynthesis
MKISYAVLTHNEGEYVGKLLNFLVNFKRPEDEVVVLDDHSTDKVTLDYLNDYKPSINLFHREFDGDASQKNYLNSLCKGDYILQLDADEMITPEFIKMLPALLENNSQVDLFVLPRINTVEGLTQEWIDKWGWNVDENGWVNFPDWQMRLYRNCDWVKWEGLLHSKIEGSKTHTYLPAEGIFAILHPKEIERQIAQNELYDKIEANGRQKYKV